MHVLRVLALPGLVHHSLRLRQARKRLLERGHLLLECGKPRLRYVDLGRELLLRRDLPIFSWLYANSSSQ